LTRFGPKKPPKTISLESISAKRKAMNAVSFKREIRKGEQRVLKEIP
jgi:hypothetical protein